jgi:hypothetical protein
VNYAEKEEKDRGSRRVISQLCLSKENRSSNDESKEIIVKTEEREVPITTLRIEFIILKKAKS